MLDLRLPNLAYLRFFGMDDGSGFKMIVNPEIERSEEKEIGEEGCLSISNVFADIEK